LGAAQHRVAHLLHELGIAQRFDRVDEVRHLVVRQADRVRGPCETT
jgi:hypothetical protein